MCPFHHVPSMQCLLKYATDAACIHGCNDFIKKLRKKLPQKYLLMNKDLFSQKVSPGNRSVTRVSSVKKERGAYFGGVLIRKNTVFNFGGQRAERGEKVTRGRTHLTFGVTKLVIWTPGKVQVRVYQTVGRKLQAGISQNCVFAYSFRRGLERVKAGGVIFYIVVISVCVSVHLCEQESVRVIFFFFAFSFRCGLERVKAGGVISYIVVI